MSHELLEAALEWHNAGWCVIPVLDDGSKAPAIRWQTHANGQPSTLTDITCWYAPGTHHGIGIVMGTASGNGMLIELEERALTGGALERLSALATDNGLGDVLARAVNGATAISGGGGLHLYVRSTQPVDGNTKLARRPTNLPPGQAQTEVLAETRGQGGYAVTPPTPGPFHADPNSQGWRWLTGSPSTAAMLSPDDLDALLALFHALDQTPEPAPPPAAGPRSTTSSNSEGPGTADDYNTRTNWPELLDGWTIVRQIGTTTYWRRPGKTIGISATTGRNDGDNLYVFSTSTPFPTETPLSRFAAHAWLHHGGDLSTTGKQLYAAGYGNRPTISTPDRFNPDPPAPRAAMTVLEPPPAGWRGPTEDGSALELVDHHHHEIRYCPERNLWLSWNGNRWAWDTAERIREHAKHLSRQLPEDGAGWRTYKKRSLSAAGISGVVRLAQTDQRITVNINDLDARPYELNTPDGIIDLRTGTSHPANPTHLHTRTTAVAPDYDRPSPTLDRFLADTFGTDADLVAFIRRLCGISAVGTVLEQILAFGHGSGANGKSTLVELLMNVLGRGESGYALAIPSNMLMIRKHDDHRAEFAQLAGARLVVCSELDDGQRFAEATIKQLTGRDSINARWMRGNPFTFTPSHTLWLIGNHKPTTSAGGPAFWRRIRLVPFTRTVPDNQQDPYLLEKLTDEAPAVLAWIARGAADYFTLNGLRTPTSVRAATDAYAHDQDTVGRFIEDRCEIIGHGVRTRMTDLRTAYEKWCATESETPVSSKRLGMELRARFNVDEQKSNGAKFYVGITLRPEPVDGIFDPTLIDDESVPDRDRTGWYR